MTSLAYHRQMEGPGAVLHEEVDDAEEMRLLNKADVELRVSQQSLAYDFLNTAVLRTQGLAVYPHR